LCLWLWCLLSPSPQELDLEVCSVSYFSLHHLSVCLWFLAVL
jgi:hypothetical protein